MINLKTVLVKVVSSKWLIPACIVALSLFFEYANASAIYYPLECSNNYSGYCSEGQDCFTQFGDSGVNYGDFCFNVPNNPHEFSDTLLAEQTISDQLDMIISGNIFAYKILGFWLPFGVILNFCMVTLLAILFKFGYFRKK
jgi:hypothetical protein